MRPIHWAAVVTGLVAVALGLKLAFSGGTPHVEDAPVISTGGPGEEASAAGSQVELLGGPPTRAEDSDAMTLGDVRAPAEAEGERRKEQLLEVLKNLDGAPIYVEGVDGPTEPEAPAPPKPPVRR